MSLPNSPTAATVAADDSSEIVPQGLQSIETQMPFTVEFLSLPTHIAATYMNRKNELAYMEACGKVFTLPLYPPMVDSLRSKEYKRLSRIVTAVRIRRLVLASEIVDGHFELKKYLEVEDLCNKKHEIKSKRLEVLEHEMTELVHLDVSTCSSSRFSAFLATQTGWKMVTSYLQREIHRVQTHHEHGALVRLLHLDDIKEIWIVMQIWSVLKCVELRCRLGLASYIEIANAKEKQLFTEEELTLDFTASDINNDKDDLSSDEDEETEKIKRKKKKTKKGRARNDKSSVERDSSDDTGAKSQSVENINSPVSFGLDKDGYECLLFHLPESTGKPPDWEIVRQYMNISSKSLQSALEAVLRMSHAEPLSRFVQQININNVVSAINDLKSEANMRDAKNYQLQMSEEETDFDKFAAASVTSIMDDIGNYLEGRIIESLRLNPYWQKTLEILRKDRIRNSGGKLVFHAAGEVEIDKNGVARPIPHADEVIDTDIFHGTVQRIHIDIVLPEIIKKRESVELKDAELNGELACLIQFGYETVVIALQRAWRRWVVRFKRHRELHRLIFLAVNSAAAVIQCWLRKTKAVTKLQETIKEREGEVITYNVVIIQKNIRRFIVYNKYTKVYDQIRKRKIFLTVSKFQAIIRGFLVRRRQKAVLKGFQELRVKEEKSWASVIIQKYARGYLVRKKVLQSLQTRRNVNKELLALTEKFLKSGDLWNFLNAIDIRMNRLTKEIDENQSREDKFASTFIEQVISKRKSQFDGAWDTFSRTITSQGRGLTQQTQPAEIALSALSAPKSKLKKIKHPSQKNKNNPPKSKTNATSSSSVNISSHCGGMDNLLQGPLLRRAVTATVREAVDAELQARKNDESRSVKLIEELQGVYHEDTSSDMISVQSKGSKSTSSSRALGLAPIKKRGSNLGFPTKATLPSNKMSVASSDWISRAVTEEASSKNLSIAPYSVKIESGEALLIDIPMGMDDTCERLLRAGSIRCYVPEFFPSHTPHSAYHMYLQLPAGLSKIRYEQEAWRWCQPVLNGLRVRGLNFIKDLLPFSKFTMFLKGVNAPQALIDTCKDIVNALLKIGAVTKGFNHSDTMKKMKTLSLRNIATQSPDVVSDGIQEADNIAANETEMMFNASESIALTTDSSLPGKILEFNIEGGHWTNMKASVEDLLIHAAFMICPNTPITIDVDDIDRQDLEVFEMGHAAFKAYVKTLQMADTDQSRREITRSRFRAALILATPYSLRLQSRELYTVNDIININLPDLEMPSMFQAQVEALLTVAVAKSVNAKSTKTSKDYATADKDHFDVPMIYDPKFQRGPFDPYGRAPRLDMRKLFKSKVSLKKELNSDIPSKYDLKESNDDLPQGIWEMETNAKSKDIKKLWKFNSVATSLKADENFGDDLASYDLSWGGTGTTENATRRLPVLDGIKLSTVLPKSPPILGSQISTFDGESTLASYDPRPVSQSKKKKEKKWIPKPDFETYVYGGFERPYKCSHPGCDQSFSRQYTLNVHEKSHLFAGYYNYKKDPQLFIDPDLNQMKLERDTRTASRGQLPSMIEGELDGIRTISSSGMRNLSSSIGKRISSAGSAST